MAITKTYKRLTSRVFQAIASGATQADGAFVLDIYSYDGLADGLLWDDIVGKRIAIQVEIVGSPTTGSLSIAVRSPGASGYATLSETVNMVSGPFVYVIRDMLVESIRFTPTSFNGTSYNVIVTVF